MNHTAKGELPKKELSWEDRHKEARKRLEGLPTSKLLDIFDSLKEDAEVEVFDDIIYERTPFGNIRADFYENDKVIEALTKNVDAKLAKLAERIDELWKALRTHHHTEGMVVREV